MNQLQKRRTYLGVHVFQHHIEPGKTLGDIGLQRRGNSDAHGEHHYGRETGQVVRVHADEVLVEEIRLLLRLKPLGRESVRASM